MASAVFSSPANVAGKTPGAHRILMLLLLCGWIVNGTYAMADNNPKPASFRLITLDPGHFHAALVQKFMYADVDPLVHVYALGPDDLAEHLKRIEWFNTRADQPTHWQEKVYTGPDFMEKMLSGEARQRGRGFGQEHAKDGFHPAVGPSWPERAGRQTDGHHSR